MSMSVYLRVLRDNPDFTRLWAANVVSLLGDWFNTIVLSAAVVRFHPGSEGIAVSLLLLARFIPPMLLSPIAGVLIDRFDRKRLLIWSNLLRAVVVLGFIPALSRPELVPLLYGLTITQFALGAVFEPGQSALINKLVRTDDLIVANTLFNVTWSVMLAVGAAIGGLVATFLNAEIALLFDSVSFVIGAALIYAIRVYKAEPAPAHVSENAAPTEKTTFRDGLRYLRQRPELASVLWVKFGNSLGNVDTLMTIYATQLFVLGNDGQLSLGIMYGTFGLGAIAGPVLLNRFNDGSVARIRRLITIGFIFTTVCWLVMGAATSLWVFCIGLFIRGMGGSANWTYSSIVVQKLGEDRYLGRVFSLDMMGFYAATILSTVVHGGMVDLVGSENTYVVALGTILVALPAMLIWMGMNRWLARSQRFAAEELQTAAAD